MILCFDTATPAPGIALADEKKVHAFREIPSDRMSESIVKTAADLLAEAKVEPGELKGIAVVVGPGSFTSLRVGLTVANQFAHQLKVPILGVRTDELVSALALDQGLTDFVFLQSMNHGEGYAVGFGAYAPQLPRAIHSFDTLHVLSDVPWVGFLWTEHETLLPSWKKQTSKAFHEAWPFLIRAWKPKEQVKYQVLEPFYGKEPNITAPKKPY